jgi:hypothetical protein
MNMNDVMLIISIATILMPGLMGALAFINYKAAKRYEKRYKLQKEENRK